MDEQKALGFVKDTQQLLATIYGDLAQPSVQKVGIALETAIEFCTSLMLPVKLQNEKWKLNYQKRLNQYKDKLENIEHSKIIEVNPQIGTPILEKLSYTTNDEIANLFINLLANASSVETINLAHPSFIQLIERISVDEAKILLHLKNKDFVPYINLRLTQNDGKGFKEILSIATLIPQEVQLLFPKNINTYLDNFVSMGILKDMEGTFKTNEKIYEPIYQYYEYDSQVEYYSNLLTNFKELEKSKSFFKITEFGKSFIKCCTS